MRRTKARGLCGVLRIPCVGLCWLQRSASRARTDRQGQGRTGGGAGRRTARAGLCRPRWQRAAAPCVPTRPRRSWLGMERGHPCGLLTRGGLKGKCALGPFLSILVIECQHKCLNVNSCLWMDKVQNKSKRMFLSLSTLVLCTNILV
jgi:hypothetical protein